MANEATINVSLSINKSFMAVDRSASYQATVAGTHDSLISQTIPTTAGGTQITIAAGVATGGQAWFRNRDATNFVTIGVLHAAVYVPLIKLLPGQVALAPLATTTIYALADTAAVVLESYVVEA
jgi:hypothetical protein